jgi:two-component system sensor histidine kinase AlgZ
MEWKSTLVVNTAGGLLLPLLFAWVNRGIAWGDFWRSASVSLVYSHSIGWIATFAFTAAAPLLRRYSRVRTWLAILAILVLCATLGCALGSLILAPLFGSFSYWNLFRKAYLYCLPICMFIGVVSVLVSESRERFRTSELKLRTRELERERAEKTAAEARLSSLESRVHPHFLFNALNSASALIREDPAKAERLIEQLAALLRFSLDVSHALVPLEREILIVRHYLEIERVRFGDRLRYAIDVPPEMLSAEVPALSIQTLVENAVKHAIAPRRDGGMVTVRAVAAKGETRIEVIDDGPGFTPAEMKQGHGLDLLQSRLATLFGDRAALDIGGSTVAIRVPL